ncbi:hypothetical protein TNCV_5045731 [Trichonephila clavipes]|uniref:Uncharacterized protein n=1 Tax=Trichonephila clavipes TaxID=2585209 RepID=A0A8X6WHR8_TRICX|nr:hypothetical protein TNCV_5045731 [Trichonephila clavipes]
MFDKAKIEVSVEGNVNWIVQRHVFKYPRFKMAPSQEKTQVVAWFIEFISALYVHLKWGSTTLEFGRHPPPNEESNRGEFANPVFAKPTQSEEIKKIFIDKDQVFVPLLPRDVEELHGRLARAVNSVDNIMLRRACCQVINSQFGLAIHQNDHKARRRFVEWAQNEIAVVPDFHKRILFSAEAHFWLNGYVNKQNCHIWSDANPQVYVETPLHPEKLTV